MASFYAELHVTGHVFPVRHCTYGVHQATHQRGRVSSKVRREPVHATLDVPDGDLLLAWAADPHRRHAASFVFKDTAGGAALETLALKAAFCVHYQEEFMAGDTIAGAYVCHLVLSDPDGFTMQAGGPARAFVAPMAREHGVPGAAAGTCQKLPVIPLTDGIGPAGWQGAKNLPSWTTEHKAARWAEYQRDKAASSGKPPKTQAAWDKQYETNRNNNIHGLKREREYATAMGATSKILKTRYTLRQIDMHIPAGIESVTPTYCGQLKTGFVYLTKQAKLDLRKDAWLVAKGQKVEYILEKGGSKPLLTAINAAGATYKIGPQIP